jgi:hypothetical protein
LFCGKCGVSLNGTTKRDKPNSPVRRIYACRTEGTTQRRRGCGGVSVNADALDHWITEAVLYRLDSPDLGKLLATEGEIDPKLQGLMEARTAQKQRLDGLVQDYATGLLTRDQLAVAKTAGERELKRLESEIDELNRQRFGMSLLAVGQSLRSAWEQNEENEWRRSILELMFTRIDIQPSDKRPYYFIDGKRTRFDPSRVEATWRV